MEELDGDVVRISSRGKFAERDIVQVREKNFHNNYILLILFDRVLYILLPFILP